MGLVEDITSARGLLRMATTHRDFAFAAKAISDLTQSAQRMTPEITNEEELEEAKEGLRDLYFQMGLMREGFEAKYGVPLDSDEGRELWDKARQEDMENEQP